MNKKIPIILGLVIIAVSAVVLMGGAFAYQYWWLPRVETLTPEEQTAGAYIKLLSPNGGEIFIEGDDIIVTWASAKIDKVYISAYYYNDNDQRGNPAVDNKFYFNEGQCRLTYEAIPAATGRYVIKNGGTGRCGKMPIGDKIKIEIRDQGGSVYDESDNYFSIVKDETADWKTYGNEEYEVKYPQDILATEINNNLVLRDYTPSYEDRNVPQREMNINKLEQEADCQDTTLLSFKDSEKIGDITFKHYVNYPEHLGAYCGMSTGCQYHDIYRSSYKGNCYEINIRRNDVAYRNDNQTFSEVFNQILSTFKFLE